MAVEVDNLCGMKNLYFAQGECWCSVVSVARHPRGSYIVLSSLLSLKTATPEVILTH